MPGSVQNFRVLGRESCEECGLGHGDGEYLLHVRPALILCFIVTPPAVKTRREGIPQLKPRSQELGLDILY